MFEYKSAYTVEPMSTDSIAMPGSSEYRQAVVPGVRQATFVDHPVELTWGDAFKSTLKYDTVLTGIANVLSKPNQFDKYWLESGAKEQAFSVLENMYPTMPEKLKKAYTEEVNSPEDLEWFRKVTNNKMTSEIAWASHPTAGILGVTADPTNFLGAGSASWLLKSKIGLKFMQSAGKLSSRGQEVLYAGATGLGGVITEAPEVLWNYEDPENLLIAGFITGGIASGVSSGIHGSKIDEALVKAYKDKVDPSKSPKDTLLDAAKDAKGVKNDEELGVFDRMLAGVLGTVDEVEKVLPGVGEATMGMPSRGLAHSADSAASIQQTLSLQRQVELHKFERSLMKIKGLYEQNWKERFSGMFGKKTSVLAADELEKHYQRAIAYLSTQYNRRTAMDIRNSETERLLKEAEEEAKAMGETLKDSEALLKAGDLRGAEKSLNEIRKRKYARDMEAYKRQYMGKMGQGVTDGLDVANASPELVERIRRMTQRDRELYSMLYPDESFDPNLETPTQIIVKNGASASALDAHEAWSEAMWKAYNDYQTEMGTVMEIYRGAKEVEGANADKFLADNTALAEDNLRTAIEDINKQLGTTPIKAPTLPKMADPNPKGFREIREPKLEELAPIEQDIVKAWEESGLGSGLGTMINKDGVGLDPVRVDADYFHTRWSLKAIDRAAEDMFGEIQENHQRRHKEATKALKEAEGFKESINETQKIHRDLIYASDRPAYAEAHKSGALSREGFEDAKNKIIAQRTAQADAEEAEAIEQAKAVALKNAKNHVKKVLKMDLRTKAAKAKVQELIDLNKDNPKSKFHADVDTLNFEAKNGAMTSRQRRYHQDRIDSLQNQWHAEDKRARLAREELEQNPADLSESDLRKLAYKRIMAQIGRQMSEYIGARYGTHFEPRFLGMIILGSLRTGGGHQDLLDAVKAVQAEMGDNLLKQILLNNANKDLNPELVRLIKSLDVSNVLEASTGIQKTNNMRIIGESSAFKERFLWDYNEVDPVTKRSLSDYLDGNMYNTAVHNVEEETSRVALSGVLVDVGGERIQLNTGENIERVKNKMVDAAVKKGYTTEDAQNLADTWAASILGLPLGDPLGPKWQAAMGFAHTVQLKNSGLYNLVEMVNVMMQFGLGRAVRNFCRAIKLGLNTSTITENDSKHLANIVSKLYAMEGRLRPEVSVITNDLTDVADTKVNKGIMYFSQFTRWANGQQHTAQLEANMCAAIYEEMLEGAIKSGDFSEFAKMGNIFNKNEIRSMQAQFKKHGMNITDWTNYRLSQKIVRYAMDMTTNTSLMLRRGERPRFLNTPWGKVAFAYQSFVWGAHNKLLRRFANEGGVAKAALFVASQLPLAILMSSVIQLLKGNDPFKDPEKMAVNVGASMSSMGLFAAALDILTRGEVGGTAPPLGVASTLYQAGVDALQGNPGKLAENVPLLGGVLPYRMGLAAFGNM